MRELYDMYGTMTPQAFTTEKPNLKTTMYYHYRPIVNLFTSFKDYANLDKAFGAPDAPAQLVNIGLIKLTHAPIYYIDIRKWYYKPEADNIWTNFKMYFKVSQKSFKKIQPVTTTDSLSYHDNQENYIIDAVINHLTKQQATEQACTTDKSAE